MPSSNQDAPWEAFFYTFVACPIQTNNFPTIAKDFFRIQDPQIFANSNPAYERINQLRESQCQSCKAKLGFNHGRGIDCWCSIRLPLGLEAYDLVANRLNSHILNLMRDVEVAKHVEKALSEVSICENAVFGGLQNGWLQESSKLHERIHLTTPYGGHDISVSAIMGYLLRDGVTLAHPRLLSEIFSLDVVSLYPPDSYIIGLASVFQAAVVANAPIRVSIKRARRPNQTSW